MDVGFTGTEEGRIGIGGGIHHGEDPTGGNLEKKTTKNKILQQKNGKISSTDLVVETLLHRVFMDVGFTGRGGEEGGGGLPSKL